MTISLISSAETFLKSAMDLALTAEGMNIRISKLRILINKDIIRQFAKLYNNILTKDNAKEIIYNFKNANDYDDNIIDIIICLLDKYFTSLKG